MLAPGILSKRRNAVLGTWTHPANGLQGQSYAFQIDIYNDGPLLPAPRGFVVWYRSGVYLALQYATPASAAATLTSVGRTISFPDVGTISVVAEFYAYSEAQGYPFGGDSSEWIQHNFSTSIAID